jgi:hypothetical protein
MPLPADFVVSGVFQSLPGAPITASYAAPNAAIVPSLGRDLSACGGRTPCTSNATVPLVAPNTLFNPRVSRLDLRLAKRLPIGPTKRLQINLDVFNVMNRSTCWPKQHIPSDLLEASQTMDGRMFQLSANLTF